MVTGKLRRITCRHRTWIPLDILQSVPEEGHMIMTFGEMKCESCGKMRHENKLRPGESIVFSLPEEFLSSF